MDGKPDCNAAARLLKQLTRYGILRLVDRGQQRKAGTPGKCAPYRWKFALPITVSSDCRQQAA